MKDITIDIQKIKKHWGKIMTLIDTGALSVENAIVKISFNGDNVITDIKVDQDVFKRKKV